MSPPGAEVLEIVARLHVPSCSSTSHVPYMDQSVSLNNGGSTSSHVGGKIWRLTVGAGIAGVVSVCACVYFGVHARVCVHVCARERV